MFMIDYREIGWWYWLATGLLVGVAIVGVPIGFDLAIKLAIALSVIQILHYCLREKSATAFSVQLRIAVLLLFLLTYFDPTRLMIWVPFAGAVARVLFGYCLMARMISLLPWNRTVPFSSSFLGATLFSAPTRGNVLHGLPELAEKMDNKPRY